MQKKLQNLSKKKLIKFLIIFLFFLIISFLLVSGIDYIPEEFSDCYFPQKEWEFVADTEVRDINNYSSLSYIKKEIWCDEENCIFWGGEENPDIICVQREENLHGNILWSKRDEGFLPWGPGEEIDEIGGSHKEGTVVGKNEKDVGGKKWLEENKDFLYRAMNTCNQKGEGWRLPTILELDGIRDNQAENYSNLPGIRKSFYWSSSEHDSGTSYYLHFSMGRVYPGSKVCASQVRCVYGE